MEQWKEESVRVLLHSVDRHNKSSVWKANNVCSSAQKIEIEVISYWTKSFEIQINCFFSKQIGNYSIELIEFEQKIEERTKFYRRTKTDWISQRNVSITTWSKWTVFFCCFVLNWKEKLEKKDRIKLEIGKRKNSENKVERKCTSFEDRKMACACAKNQWTEIVNFLGN